jgi:hypothetical protein
VDLNFIYLNFLIATYQLKKIFLFARVNFFYRTDGPVIKMSASEQCNLELESYWGCHHALTYEITTGYFQKADESVVQYSLRFVCLIGFYVTPTNYRSYRDVPALLEEGKKTSGALLCIISGMNGQLRGTDVP